MNLFFQPNIPEGILHLDTDESKHCTRVLRKRKGDSITITDGRGFFYDVIITEADAKKCSFEIATKTHDAIRDYKIHIAISPTKNTERIEWFVEKAVEIGIDEITFMACKNTERPFLKLERLEKVAISAMKQSLKATLPKLCGLTKFVDVVKNCKEIHKFIAFVDSANPNNIKDFVRKGSSYLTLIGPEGDFSDEELLLAVEHGFHKVSLGNSRLRTETAGIAACHILNIFQ